MIGHDNRFNRWVAGPDQFYFANVSDAASLMQRVLTDDASVEAAKHSARARYAESFEWPMILWHLQRWTPAKSA